MRSSVRSLLNSAGLFLVSGCWGGEEAPVRSVTFDTLGNGTVQVENLDPARGASAEGWFAVERKRIGAVESEGPEQLEFPLALELDSMDRVWVLEGRAQEVKVFLPDGRFSHRIGNRGSGPGELDGAVGLLAGDGGQVIVLELRNARYSVFSEDGSFLEARRRGLTNVLYSPWPAEFDESGRLIDWTVLRPSSSGDGRRNLVSFLPVILGDDLQPVDTLPPVSFQLDVVRPRVPRPFAGDLRVFLSRRGQIHFGVTTEYRVFQRSLQGDTMRVFSLESTPQEISSHEVDSVVRSRRRDPGLEVTAADVPSTKPILAHITGDGEGHIFVFPVLTGEEKGAVVDVFTEDGLFLDRVQLPVRLEMTPAPIVRRGQLLGVTRGPYDTPFVVNLSIGPSGIT